MNIVFDLGGVVFKWQPDAIMRSVFDDPETRTLVRKEIFEHEDWLALDRGSIRLDLAVDRAVARTGLSRHQVRRLFDAVLRHLVPIDGMFDLIHSLARADNRLYVLSNMHVASIDYLEREHGIWDQFSGSVISCRVRMIKPEPAIYQHLLETHGLRATDTVFIDDMADNLAGAAAMGIATVQYVDPAQCRQALAALGCIQ